MRKIFVFCIVSILLNFNNCLFANEYEFKNIQQITKNNVKTTKPTISDWKFYSFVKDNDISMIEKAFKSGFDTKTPGLLDLAISNNNIVLVKLLIEYGADINKKYFGLYPIESSMKYPEITFFLKTQGAIVPDRYAKKIDGNIAQYLEKNKFIQSHEFYKYENNKYIFKPLSEDKYKQLTAKEKIFYKDILRADKYLNIARKSKDKKFEKYHVKALFYNPLLLAAYYNLSLHYYQKNQYMLAIYYGNYYIQNAPKNYRYKINLAVLADSYYNHSDYQSAIKCAKKYISNYGNEKKDLLPLEQMYCIVANASYKLLNKKYNKKDQYLYQEIETNVSKYRNSSNVQRRLNAHELLYLINIKKGNKKVALNEAKEIAKINSDFNSYIRVALLSPRSQEKIHYFKLAQKQAKNNDEMLFAASKIAHYEQEKINQKVKSFDTYVNAPNWYKILATMQIPSISYLLKRQDNFFNSTNNCMQKYTGTNLIKCFNQINKDEENFNKYLIEYQHLQKQDELILLNEISNYYQRRNMYYLRSIDSNLQDVSNSLNYSNFRL